MEYSQWLSHVRHDNTVDAHLRSVIVKMEDNMGGNCGRGHSR